MPESNAVKYRMEDYNIRSTAISEKEFENALRPLLGVASRYAEQKGRCKQKVNLWYLCHLRSFETALSRRRWRQATFTDWHYTPLSFSDQPV